MCTTDEQIEHRNFRAAGDEEILAEIKEVGLCDAHCHPTTYNVEELANVGSMTTNFMVCMSTSLKDMDDVRTLAANYPERVIPAYGLHPWLSHYFYVGTLDIDKSSHYKRVLVPEPNEEFIRQLPDPLSIDVVIRKMQERLQSDSKAIIGECGLDKTFRIPDTVMKKLSKHTVAMGHQIEILKAQLEVAAEYKRPVSLHGVKCPQNLLDTIKLFGKRLTSICLHSFSGNAQFMEQNWYMKKTQMDRKDLPIVYVSVSHLINNCNRSTSIEDLVEVIPPDRLLLESDYHSAGSEMDELNLRILRAAAAACNEGPKDIAGIVKRNLISFLNTC